MSFTLAAADAAADSPVVRDLRRALDDPQRMQAASPRELGGQRHVRRRPTVPSG